MEEKKEIFGSDIINVEFDLADLHVIHVLLQERMHAIDAILDFAEQRGIRHSLHDLRQEYFRVKEVSDKVEKYNYPINI